MSQIILDFGSANTCKNNFDYVKRMLDSLKAVDTGKHEVIIKWQLFKQAGKNIPLKREIFRQAYDYAASLGYQTTSSVFDKESLDFLLQFNPCFVKIANRRELDYLIGEIPRKIPVYVSYGDPENLKTLQHKDNVIRLLCVSNYPATLEEYEETFGMVQGDYLQHSSQYDFYGISDHTTNFGLWYRYQPRIIEMHYGLPDSTGLDAGPFMRTPRQLAEIL